jgi:inner membrane protein
MDNLTHSLAGAVLGQMGLKAKTGLAMPTLIIAANLPDIDAVAVLLGGHQHLAIRRGITHGPIAMVLLPLLLWAIMLAWNKWRPSEKRLPVHKGWLLVLAYIGTVSHPALDWLNNYGVRLLEPFSSEWFYGDTIFIIDIWIWAALIASVWLSRRRERRGRSNWQRPAWLGFTAICAYIFLNGGITGVAEASGAQLIQRAYDIKPTMVVASPVPIKFWERELLWRYRPADEDGALYGSGFYSAFGDVHLIENPRHSHRGPTKISINNVQNADRNKVLRVYYPMLGEVEKLSNSNEELKAYLFWSRMPVVEGDLTAPSYVVRDQRFMDPLVGDRFSIRVEGSPDKANRQ